MTRSAKYRRDVPDSGSSCPDPRQDAGQRPTLSTPRLDRGDYMAFLNRKSIKTTMRGVVPPKDLAPHLFAFQADCVRFGVEAGSWGLFLDTGLGKTACELEWARFAAEHSNGRALILAPLAVGHQIVAEGIKWGYNARSIRSAADVADGINVCNYDRMHLIDPESFGAVALDESSILKNFTGATSRALISAFARHRWRMSASATPAPNDHQELATHSEFVGALSRDEMLTRFFIHDSADTKSWRLKGHAVSDFWSWMASWSRMAAHPRDLGDDRPGFDLPELRLYRHETSAIVAANPGELFASVHVSATDMHRVKRQTSAERADMAARIASSEHSPCIVWCDTNYDADAVAKLLATDDVVEVRGSDSIDDKESAIDRFTDGSARIIITKPSICGYGLNWQHCSRMVFVGRTFSYESYYQAVRRCWRFGQIRPVDVHLIVAPGEDEIGKVIDRKKSDHDAMKSQMVAAMKRAMGRAELVRVAYNPTHAGRLPSWM